MSNYVKIDSGIVVQRQPYHEDGFMAAPDGVICGWLWDGEEFAPPPAPKGPSQFEIDKARYSKRAAVKDELIAYMAADNMSRVRSGQWTVAELTGLMNDPDVSAATAYMGTLSYELAAQAIANAQTPLMTTEIKSALVSKLQQHFYLTP